MEGISDLKIIGTDERRPPIIRKEPYIDVFFKLSHQAPATGVMPSTLSYISIQHHQQLKRRKVNISKHG